MSGKFALIIGNTEYIDPGLEQLTAPGKDTEDFARVLKDRDIGAFDEVNILLNEPEPVVRGAIDEFFDQKKPDDLLVLYFSGHGVRDELGALYLAVTNTNRARLRSTAVKSDYIREAMDQSRSRRQVLILDCCNSGAYAQGTKAATGVSIGTATAFEAGYGRIILTASDSTQFAWEGNQVIGETDNSLFTHYLVEGMEGEADLDGDGRITVDELYDYAYEKVRLSTPKQTPSKFSSKQQGEIVLRERMRIEDIKPISLPNELIEATEDSRTFVREGAVQQLEKLLKGKNLGLARSAQQALERMEKEDDSRRVSQAATQVLEPIRQAEKAEAERKAIEEAERIAAQKAKEERIALEKAEAERKAKQEAERLLAEQKAEEERKAKKEAKRLAALKAKELQKAREEAELIAIRKAQQERLAREKAEFERKAKDEAERLAAQKSEEERLVHEKAEEERKAKEEAEKLARAKAEGEAKEKVAREAAEKAVAALEKTATPEPFLQQQPSSSLKWVAIGVIALCIFATGAWGISYLASQINPPATAAPTEPPATQAPATAPPATEALATEVPATELPISPIGSPDLTNVKLIARTDARTSPGLEEENDFPWSYDTGDNVRIIGETPDKNWLAVIGNGRVGWIPIDSVNFNSESKIPIIQDIDKLKISGRIISSLGEQIDRINLAILMQFNGEEIRADAFSDKDGNFYFYAPIAGSWNVQVVGISCDSRIMVDVPEPYSCRLNGYFEKFINQTIDVPQVESIVFIYEKASTVFTGKIVDSQGNPISDGRVIAARDDGAKSWGDPSSDGTFEIPGSYGRWEFYAVSYDPYRQGPHVEINVVEGEVFQPITIVAPE